MSQKHENNGRAKGQITEDRFFEAMSEDDSGQKPKWLLSVARASRQEDAEGIDAIIKTDIGKIFVQIKSSETGARKFMNGKNYQKNKDIVIIVILKGDSAKHIRHKAYEKIGIKRKELITRQKT